MPDWRKVHIKVTWSDQVNNMPNDFTRLFWTWLPLVLDSEGRGKYQASWIKSKVFPIRDDVSLEMINEGMIWFIEHGMIEVYEANGVRCFHIPTWHEYQNTSKEAQSTFPAPISNNEVSQELVGSKSGVGRELVKSKSGVSRELVGSRSSTEEKREEEIIEEKREEKINHEGIEKIANVIETPTAATEVAKKNKPSIPEIPTEKEKVEYSVMQRKFLGHFGASRFKNKVQADLILRMEAEYGESQLMEFCHWASKNGFSLSRACGSVEGALKNWSRRQNGNNGKNGHNNNGHTRGVAVALEVLQDLENERNGQDHQNISGIGGMFPVL